MSKRKLPIIVKIILTYIVCFLLHVGYCLASGTSFKITWRNEGIILVVTLLLVVFETLWQKRKFKQ